MGKKWIFIFVTVVLATLLLNVNAVGNLFTFQAGTPIKASEVNSNFAELKTAIEAPVSTERLANQAVTPAKLANQGCPAGQALGGYNNGNLSCVAVQGGAGLTEVARDESLSGNGTAGSPLGLADGAVSTKHLSDNAVTAAKIASASVSSDKLAAGVVTSDKLADGVVTSGKLASAPFVMQSDGGIPQLELRQLNSALAPRLQLSKLNSPASRWDVAVANNNNFMITSASSNGAGANLSLEPDGDLRVLGDISQPRARNGATKASALVVCGATPSVSRSFNQVAGTITVSGDTAGVCTVDFGFDVSDRFWQTSSYSTVGTAGIDPQVVNCQFGAALGNNKLACVVHSIVTGSAQIGSFMITVF